MKQVTVTVTAQIDESNGRTVYTATSISEKVAVQKALNEIRRDFGRAVLCDYTVDEVIEAESSSRPVKRNRRQQRCSLPTRAQARADLLNRQKAEGK
jgi:hypothetical protein